LDTTFAANHLTGISKNKYNDNQVTTQKKPRQLLMKIINIHKTKLKETKAN